MSDEIELAVEPVPEQVETVAPVSDEVLPEESPVEEQSTKTFTQEELDAAIGKRLAIEQRKWKREQGKVNDQLVTSTVPGDLKLDDFDSHDDYIEAVALRKAEELVAKREAAKQHSQLTEAYYEREEQAREKYDDFEQIAYNSKLPVTDVMADTIRASEIGPDILYYLGSNPKEATRIHNLAPNLQIKEIGKLEERLSNNPPVKKVSSAPTPITPVTAGGNGSSSYDTTDPRSIKTMDTSQWIEADRQRQLKKLEAQRLR